jgi:predicted alpha/beta hydrolase family esterase
MREKVLILHGWGGSDYPHWQSWLGGEIAKDYGTVAFPLLEHPHFPAKNRWMKQVKALLNEFRPDVVICHSLANTLWFHLCNEGEIEAVKRLLLVAPPRLDLELHTIKSFFPVDVPKALYAEEAMLVTSDNDPYMEADEAQKLQRALGIEMKVLENAGHINADSGFGEWPWVLEWFKRGAERRGERE